ncbi:unnamed protein product [Peronospora belbahrii]|uniref:LsmAD domain-containing protein n=1 Tax=Peronospora belbahrii TaxID=622444 RepID=A0AAU9LDB3_9STRA|nr:unnamed protein product [Peronospora belbahrii]
MTRPSNNQVTTARKTTTNSNGPKNQSKKKKSQQSKSHGNSKDGPAGPRPVNPSPVSGPWGKPKNVTSNIPPPGFTSNPSTRFSDAQVRLLRHRALFAFRFLVGKAVELQLAASDERYAGILDCVDPDEFSVVLKNAKRLNSGVDAKPFVDGSTVIFRHHQLAHLVADGAVNYTDGIFASGASAALCGFQTDTEISRRKEEHLYGRELEAASSWLDPALDTGALEDSTLNGKCHSKNQGKAGWNQFEANEKLFGVVSTYDENIYTTKLDKSKISTEQSRTAEKLAQEIESQSSAGNFHLQEERGQTGRGGKHVNDLDEEARYSSVDRRTTITSGENAYVPPALRKAQRQSDADMPRAKTAKTLSTIAPTAATTPTPANAVSAVTTPTPANAVSAVTTPTPANAVSAVTTPTPANAASVVTTPSPATTPTATTPTSSVSELASATTPTVTAPTASKPLSFSEAVTGRSAVAAKSEVKSQTAAKDQPEKMKGAAFPSIAAASVQVNGKDNKPVLVNSKGASPKKKDASSGKEKRIEGKDDSKSSSSSSPMTTTSTTIARTKLAKNETSKAGLKKGLNPDAKEFKLSASAVEFTPSFSVPMAIHGLSPYHGGSPGPMAYPHPVMGYPPPMQEEWMYDGAMGGGESSEMDIPPYMQGGYDGYQQQGYNPQGYQSPLYNGHFGSSVPYTGDLGIPGCVECAPSSMKQMASALKKNK